MGHSDRASSLRRFKAALGARAWRSGNFQFLPLVLGPGASETGRERQYELDFCAERQSVEPVIPLLESGSGDDSRIHLGSIVS